MMNLEKYLFGQAGNSARTYIEIFGVDAFVATLKATAPFDMPDKYKKLIEEGKRVRQCSV